MDKNGMRVHAAKMIEANRRVQIAIDDACNLVREGMLTREEAAMCAAGAAQKAADKLGLPGASGLGYHQLRIDQVLDGDEFNGLVIGRHV